MICMLFLFCNTLYDAIKKDSFFCFFPFNHFSGYGKFSGAI